MPHFAFLLGFGATAQASILYDQAELESASELIIDASITEATCRDWAVSYDSDNAPILDRTFVYTASVNEVLKGEIGPTARLYTRHREAAGPNSQPEGCSWNPEPHPEGLRALLYLHSDPLDDEIAWTDLPGGEVQPVDGSAPIALPSCGEDVYEAEIEAWQDAQDTDDTNDTDDTDDTDDTVPDDPREDDDSEETETGDTAIPGDDDGSADPPGQTESDSADTKGCTTAGVSAGSGLAALLSLCAIARRRRI